MAAQDKEVKHAAAERPRPGWWRHNGRRLLVVLLLLVVIVAAGGYWMLIGRIRHLDAYQKAMQTIQSDKDVQAALGQPIKAANWPPPSARLEDRERDIRWDIEGPKGRAGSHVFSKLMEGKWETIVLEVTLPDGKKLPLNEPGDDNVAKPFDGGGKADNKPDNKKPDDKGPAPDINMGLPPDIPGPGGK
jgi:hypothetical protein